MRKYYMFAVFMLYPFTYQVDFCFSHGQMIWPGDNNSQYDKIYDGEWIQGALTGHGRMR